MGIENPPPSNSNDYPNLVLGSLMTSIFLKPPPTKLTLPLPAKATESRNWHLSAYYIIKLTTVKNVTKWHLLL